MTTPKSGTTNKYNQIDSSTNIFKNPGSPEILKQAKLDLLEDLGDKFEHTLVNRCQFADKIAKKRAGDKMPSGNMTLRTSPNLTVNIDEKLDEYKDKHDGQSFRDKYKYLFETKPEGYQQELKRFDTMLAERCILDVGGSIEFKKGDIFEFGKTPKTESSIAFNNLNDLDEYKGKIERISKVGDDGKDGDYYVIKWKDERIAQIKKRYKELLKAQGGTTPTEDDSDKNKAKGDENKENAENNTENTDNEGKNKDYEDLKKKYDELKKENEKQAKENEKQAKQIKELIERLNAKDTNTENEPKDPDTNKLENSEALDETLNYISRSFVEGLVVGIRGAKGYPTGTIRIREEVINIEEFEFYEEFKQEYIEAKGDATKLSRLDKEFAEMIILFSPKGADYKNKFRIKLSESELKDGLYVSDERLARYGVMIKVSEYEREVIEREIIRERKIVEEIETTITELQTQIIELTTSISIERYNKETILEEIRSKKKLLAILIKRYKALQLSLRGLNNNDEELKKLREEESRLQKEYNNLLKEKERQDNLKKEIDKIKKKIKELENKNKPSKLKDKAEEIKNEIENLTKERNEYKWRLNNGTIAPDEIVTLKSNIEKLNKQIKKLESDLKILNNEIEQLEAELKDKKENGEGSDKKLEAKIREKEKEIFAKSAEIGKLQGELNEIGKIIIPTKEQKERKNFLESEIKRLKDELSVLHKELDELKALGENGEDKDSEEIKRLKNKLAELEGQLDPDIDKKLGAKKEELDSIRKQIEEKEQSVDKGELEAQLTLIIEEWDALLDELTELERSLTIEKEEGIKITIKKRIEEINKKLVIISQKYTKFEQFIHIYKSRVTTRRYTIYQVVPFGPTPVPNKPFNMTSVISDMGTDVFKEKAALKVEEELKRQYKSLGRWQMGSRLALFLGRGSKRKKMMKNEMNNMANTAFQTNAAYATLNEQSQNAADRHGHELVTNMDAVNRITTVHNPQVDQLCKDYLIGRETDPSFQTKFNAIVAADANIQNALRGQNITHIGTNILLQLKERVALEKLINNLDSQLNSYIYGGHDPRHIQNMQNFVEQYIRDYQKTPAFMAIFEPFIKSGIDTNNSLERYLKNQKAIMKMQITNLTMNIDILNKGKSAYQIDNKDREKGWKYKLGHFMDKHPRGTAVGSLALAVGLGAVTAPMSAVAGAAVTTGVFGSYVGFTNYIKKWTHHTKEQNTHEKNVVTDYRNEQAKIQNWQNLALNGSGRKKYKAKRQLALYDQTTQENIQLSNQISEYITKLSSKIGTLSNDEENFMRLNLIEGWARLKYYRAMGHNFLASEKVDETEKDMRRLEKAITLGLQKIGKTTNDIETTMTATNTLGANITYAVIQNDLKASYDKSLIQFKRERKNLALKYGISTAALSIGTALGFQYLTGSGVFAKDVPATPGTPGTPSSTTNYAGGTDNFALSGDNLSNGSVYSTTKSAITGSGAPSGSELTFNYSVGTDGTKVIGSFNPTSKFTTLTSDFANTSLYPNLSPTQVTSLQTELSKIMSDPTFVAAFKDSDLAKMRAMESVEHFARALNDSARPDLILHFSHTGSVPGMTPHTLGERFMTGAIDITTPAVPGTPGTPGIPAKTWGRWLMGVPLFFNTFKDRKAKKNETTDQNFGDNAQGNQQQPNQPHQPQANQPHQP